MSNRITIGGVQIGCFLILPTLSIASRLQVGFHPGGRMRDGEGIIALLELLGYFTYKGQDTSASHTHRCAIYSDVHLAKSLHTHTFPAVKKTDSSEQNACFCVREGGQRESGLGHLSSPDACPASPQGATGTWQQQQHDVPAQPVVPKREFYLWLNPLRCPGSLEAMLVCSQ